VAFIPTTSAAVLQASWCNPIGVDAGAGCDLIAVIILFSK
jgi:hypothetical protein